MEEMEKAERDYEFLRQCFCEVLHELGQSDVADVLAPAGAAPAAVQSQAAAQALSIAFQLLNLAEENAAAQHQRAIEATEGCRNHRRWGRALQQLKERG
jgi:phosphoenolpyruvate carboxylase